MAARVEPVTAKDAFEVTPSDATVFSAIPSALYIGDTGDVEVVTESGNKITFAAVPAGTFIPLRVVQVTSGTGASDIVALVY